MMSKFVENINCISQFLAERDISELSTDTVPDTIDLAVLLGNSLVGSIYIAAQTIKSSIARQLLISGGIGHSTNYLRKSIASHADFKDIYVEGRAEADIIADVLMFKLGINASDIIIENVSTNCGTNAEQSRLVLDGLNATPSSMLLIQDPTMQRRSQACFNRAWCDKPEVEILSYAPFIPTIDTTEDGYKVFGSNYPAWEPDRFISLVLGEVPRLRDDAEGYGPKGRNYFDHVDMPLQVLNAYKQIRRSHPELVREIPV